ncbi:MAG: acetyltransferase [Gammaproteobacteria bacterium]|nr:acetyltransferase [Gammaproteobacteria bacterium]
MSNGQESIRFIPFADSHVSLWKQWIEKPYVKDVWFIEGYATSDQILQAKQSNGYDYPFMIYLDDQAIGYLQCCDLYAYRSLCEDPKGLFTNEKPGTFCMDLFIGEKDYLNKGYGTRIVKDFIDYVFENFDAKVLLIDPACSNKRAIRCYEKAGFKFVKIANDGITDCYVMRIDKRV